ncbi:response regulator transcription factor [Cetobacterium sp. 2G large]|uniref:response regulator transcription factor n=1 Tax=Cetobacterium TaxID=180162 RepID=UPI00163BFA1B|nr:response regulator transcription factor [Cetobacterium sp. 2G large]MBC2852556.1 response regulator transcription factor [Cetobacterium sp. 2G large]
MILIVEDTESLRKLTRKILEKEGFSVDEAENGEIALEKISGETKYSLILLDIMMPKMDGMEFIKNLRIFSEVPVVFITALSDERSQVLAYENGADGYLTKPFSKALLLSMVKRFEQKSSKPVHYDELTLFKSSRGVFIHEKEIHLPTKERELLFYLEENKGVIKTREQILDAIWGYDFYGNDRVVDKHIAKLRDRLGESNRFIKTVKALGYKFEV